MTAHFDVPRGEARIPIRRLKLAMNTHLPEDVRIVASQYCSGEFHSRFGALGKEYRYFIWNHAAMNPLWRAQAWHVPMRLNLPAMREASARLVGRRDFKSFAGQHAYEVGCTVRTLKVCRIGKKESLITIVLEADGFLYRMCRNIAGTLVQVGQGKISAGDMESILKGRDRGLAGMTAPPHGLTLWKVFYPGSKKQPEEKRTGGTA
jgi:tRNA pseudouridine38-40 synthase